MPPFVNAFNHLWGRRRAPTTPSSDVVSNFDGMSEGGDKQQIQESTVYENPAPNNFDLPPAREHHLGQIESPLQSAHPQDCSRPSQQLAVPRSGIADNDMQSFKGVMQGLDDMQDQNSNLPREQSLHSATAPAAHAASRNLHTDAVSEMAELSKIIDDAIGGDKVMEETLAVGHSSNDVFAQFTNEDVSGESGQEVATQQQHVDALPTVAVPMSCDSPYIEPEPSTDCHLRDITSPVPGGASLGNAVEGNTSEARATTLGPVHVDPIRGSVKGIFEALVSPSRVDGEPLSSQANYSHSATARGDDPNTEPAPMGSIDELPTQLSFEQHTQGLRQSSHDFQPASSEKDPKILSAGSVLGHQNDSSEATTLSLSDLDLMSNQHLFAQQWSQRQGLSGMGAETMEATQIPILHRRSVEAQQQHFHNIADLTDIMENSHNPATSQTQLVDLPQQHPVSSNNTSIPNLIYSMSAQLDQVWPHLLPLTQQSSYLPTQTNLHGPAVLQQINEVHEESSDDSDDDEPLATRAPRHRWTTASPGLPSPSAATTSAIAPEQQASIHTIEGGANPSSAKKQPSSIIELSDDDDKETGEPISWALPKYEAIYHPPATASDLPMAKISIPGLSHNLVREELMLTEDHSEQEMQLLLDVFLPAQQALRTADPEPAHAVINFHTIAVMVLEAFTQYEIGDEMGRGYGFHGGHSAQRPGPSPGDDAAEQPRIRAAQDADVDEIFFAVVDRWRAGLLMEKCTLGLIRGCQEFCDVALDVIHHVKAHGLMRAERLRARKERSDKGVARGPRGSRADGSTGGGSGVKRKAVPNEPKKNKAKQGQVTTLSPRKKAKLEDKKKPAKTKAKTKANIKANASTPGLTVTPRRR